MSDDVANKLVDLTFVLVPVVVLVGLFYLERRRK